MNNVTYDASGNTLSDGTRDISRTATVRREIVMKRIRELLGVDVESDSDEKTTVKEKVE